MERPDDRVATAAYQPEPAAAAAARRFVRDTLRSWRVAGMTAGTSGLVDDAVLLTSELVTNAVVHAGTPVQVTCRIAEGDVEVVVRDSHPARPVVEPPAEERVPAERTSGRGLLLPTALATAWGVTYSQAAKAVWFRIGLPGASGDQAPAARRPPAESAPVPAQVLRPPPPAAHPGGTEYGELLQQTVDAARSALSADAACALMADEDGDLRVRAVSGSGFPSREAAGAPAAESPAVMTAPLVVDGRVAGLLSVAAARPRTFDDGDAAALQELADRGGPPLERARLSELERVRRGRISVLADLSAALDPGSNLSAAELLEAVGEAVVPRLAEWCAVLLVTGDSPPRTALARHANPAREAPLAWLLDRAAAWGSGPAPGARAGAPWPLTLTNPVEAPAGAAELTLDTAWCFPVTAPERCGLLALGRRSDDRLPKEVSAVAVDVARRIGLALRRSRVPERADQG